MASLKNVYISGGTIDATSFGVIEASGKVAAWGVGGDSAFGINAGNNPAYMPLLNGYLVRCKCIYLL